jgi:hypothetical protein
VSHTRLAERGPAMHLSRLCEVRQRGLVLAELAVDVAEDAGELDLGEEQDPCRIPALVRIECLERALS